MAYTFLSLVNDVLQRVNEVPLDSTNFSAATGFNSDMKNAINLTVNEINVKEFEWPFNHVSHNETLVIDQVRYDFPALARTIAWDTFRIRGDASLNNKTQKLMPVDYEEYLDKYSDMEYQPDKYHSLPTNVVRTRADQFGMIPAPDKLYSLDYEYYQLPTYMENHDDVPTIPEVYKYVIHNGAMYYAYAFRGEVELAALQKQIFEKQLESLRTILINRNDYARSSYIRR